MKESKKVCWKKRFFSLYGGSVNMSSYNIVRLKETFSTLTAYKVSLNRNNKTLTQLSFITDSEEKKHQAPTVASKKTKKKRRNKKKTKKAQNIFLLI